MAARATLAVTLLLMLLAGTVVWPAAASGPLCMLACCASRAPHAAGSCMHGSCKAGVATNNARSKTQHQSHHHHEQQPAQESGPYDPAQAFAEVNASAGGSEMGAVPTIEATYEASGDAGGQADMVGVGRNSDHSAMSTTVISKPCPPDCGACVSGFAAPKRSRDHATLAPSNHSLPRSSVKLAGGKYHLTRARSALGRQCVPRGPPLVFSC
jgi:hypothetical protein